MATKTLHMIGNAHIDPVWLWQWQEGFHEVKATFRSALDRLAENEDCVFVASSAVFYEWVEKSDPAMFAAIKARIAEGRWEVVGGWWLEPDCNIPCGESFVRQALYGQRYLQEKFGSPARVGFNVDSFGHNASLPQLLHKSGLDSYIFMRPGPHENAQLDHLFWWQAADGSRVLAYRVPFMYQTRENNIADHIQQCAALQEDTAYPLMCFYGVGNHGGGPTKRSIQLIRALNEDPDLPPLEFSSPGRYFEAIKAGGYDLPTVQDELQHHARGCYAAHSGIKQWNRQAENHLLTAEIMAALAHTITGQPYPDFTQAWHNVLFNQFHDILAGTSLEAAYEDARNSYGEAIAMADRALNYAVQALAWQVHIEPAEGMTPVHVFNPHPWPTQATVAFEYGNFESKVTPGNVTLLDEADNEIPLQFIQSQATINGRDRLTFTADLPALGYQTYRMVQQPPVTPTSDITAQAGDEPLLENDHVRLTFDPATGCVASLVDKVHGVEVIAGDGAQPVVITDDSDTWSHGIDRFDQMCGVFQASQMQVLEHGPVQATLRITSTYENSTLHQDFTLHQDAPRVDVRVTVNWQEQLKLLKLRFPANVTDPTCTYEIPFGHIKRAATGDEEPGQRWVDIAGQTPGGTTYGLSLLNDGKYSFDCADSTIGLTVLRSPAYAHHDPRQLSDGEVYTYIDQGVQQFTYSLVPHPGDWQTADLFRRAAELNQPPIVLVGTYHAGALPLAQSFLTVEPANIIVSAIKQAEDGDDLIVRAYETHGVPTQATINLTGWQRVIQADFAPAEIKTFRVPRAVEQPIIATNLLEWPIE